ncbi:MAG: acetylxylan esterase [Proteobacteria bacterium]|nr:acetylxylan esterase [Pseudomonadota bacterium]
MTLPTWKTAALAAGLWIGFGGVASAQFQADKDPPLTRDQVCQAAVYRLADGRLLDIGPGPDQDLRWRLNDGRVGRLSAKDGWASTLGWTGKPDGVVISLPACGGGDHIGFADNGKARIDGVKIALDVQDVTFAGDGGVKLKGRLVLPHGSGRVPIVVETHGSEHSAATDYYFDQRLNAAQGVGVFVYDKRGTGASEGKYTQDYTVLARDAVAAMAEARRLAGSRLGRIGYQGGSQGGWIAPLAETLTPTGVDFVIVDYGLAGSVAEENTDQTVLELKRRGFGAQDLQEAAEVAEATNVILGSHFRDGFEQLDAVKAKYVDRPWFKRLGGQYTGEFLKHSSAELRQAGPAFDVGTPVYWDALAVLRKVKAPMLWVLADEDTLAPNATTRTRLAALAAQGKAITVLAFPATDHGIQEFVTTPDGERVNTRYADGYFRTTPDFARDGRLHPPYGRSRLLLSPNGKR